jgi:uncharacterized protein (DUF2141 family)
MASQRTRKVEVLRVVSRFIAILALFAFLTIVVAPATLAQIPQAGKRRAASSHSTRQNAEFTTSGSSLFLPVATYDPGGHATVFVAVGDVNGDGKLDVVVANYCGTCGVSYEGTVGVLLGNGDGTFQPAVTYASGAQGARAVAIADVNGDGKPDLVVGHDCGLPYCDGDLTVLIGNGDGTFQSPISYVSGTLGAISVAVADVNGDRKPDLVAVGGADSNGDGAVGILLGNGDGTFQKAVTYSSGGMSAESVAIKDVNGDGRPDLLVANMRTSFYSPEGAVAVLLGNGDGTFQKAVIYAAGGQYAMAFAIADLNGDGKPDVVVAEYVTQGFGVGVLLGNGDGTFQPAVAYYAGGVPTYWQTGVAVADVNGDGKPDLVLASGCTSSSTCQNEGVAGVLLGNGDGTFQPALTFNSGGYLSGGVAVGDVNGDGRPDVLVVSPCDANCAFFTWAEGSVGVLLNNSAPRKAATTTTLTSSLNPSFIGQAVTFTATVTSTAGTPPNGEIITFYKGSTVLGTAPLSGGSAALTTSSLPAGIFTITARYPGDSGFAASTSPPLRQVVNSTTKSATTTTFTSSLNPSIYGQRVTFTAKVTTAGALPPTGHVAFTWGGIHSIGSATLNSSGVATLTRSNLNADPYPLTAGYSGDVNNLSSTSPVVNQLVLQTTSAPAITASPNPSTVGQAVTFSAKITSPTVMPTGPVTFTAGKTVLGTAQLSSGKASFTTSSLPAGSTVVTVTYNGNSNIAKSAASVTQVVKP